MKGKFLRSTVLGLGGLVALCNGGCNEGLIDHLALMGAEQAVVSGVRTGIEGPRGTTVNVYNNQNGTQNTSQEIKMGMFLCNSYVDINRDGAVSIPNEVFGYGKTKYNLDEEDMVVGVIKNTPGQLILESWTSDGRKLGETSISCTGGRMYGSITGPGYNCPPSQGDFMDEIKRAGAGDYRITLRDPSTGEFCGLNVQIDRD